MPQKQYVMKKYILIISSYIVLAGALFFAIKENIRNMKMRETAESNVKAYDKLLSVEKARSTAYQLTADQLSNANDSIIKELNEVRYRLRIKDKDLKSLQKVSSEFSRKDTIILDTVFSDKSLAVDTLVGDMWYNVSLSLRYPSSVILRPKFRSEKSIIVYLKKETVNPPKKCWLLRLFQKKHRVLNVEVTEKNPYVSNEVSRYVEIVR